MQLNKMQLYFIFEKTTVSKRKQKLFMTQPNITHFQTPIDVGKNPNILRENQRLLFDT